MCRYSYVTGACANKHVDSLECVGLDKCGFSGMNLMTSMSRTAGAECGHEQWLGLYCEKYRRFSCPGREQCVSPDAAQRSLTMHDDRSPTMGEEL